MYEEDDTELAAAADEDAEVAEMEAELRRRTGSGGDDDDDDAEMEDAAAEASDVAAKYNMADYDKEDDGIAGIQMFGAMAGEKNGLTYHETNEEDPYMIEKDTNETGLPDEEMEDYTVKPTDMMIAATRCEEDYFNIEVYVYEEEEEEEEEEENGGDAELAQPGNYFVHHDVMLPDFALSCVWTGSDPTNSTATRGNFVAVATAAPMIEIWNLDVYNAMEPTVVLGGAHMRNQEEVAAASGVGEGKKGKKKKKQAAQVSGRTGSTVVGHGVEFEPGSHQDSVMGLDWNPARHHILASSAADATVKLWDTVTQQCIHTYEHHTGKVQGVAWNPAEPSLLLSGGFDRRAAIVDVRAAAPSPAEWAIAHDTESVCWNPHATHSFFVAMDSGDFCCFDARTAGSAPLYTVKAHTKDCSAMAINPLVPHMMLTASTDKTLKIWDIAEDTPACVYTHDSMDAGAIFSAAFAPDEPFYVAAVGAKGKIRMWDSLMAKPVRRRFEGRVPALASRRARILPRDVAGADG